MRKLELFENQNFEKDIYKMGFEKTFSKPNKKKTKIVIRPGPCNTMLQHSLLGSRYAVAGKNEGDSPLDIYICWNMPKGANIDPLIQTLYFLAGMCHHLDLHVAGNEDCDDEWNTKDILSNPSKVDAAKSLTNDSAACSNHLKQDSKTQDTIANSLNSRSSKKLESQWLSSEPLQPVLFFPAYRGHSDSGWH